MRTESSLGDESALYVTREPPAAISTAFVGMKCGTGQKRSANGPSCTGSPGSYSMSWNAFSMCPSRMPTAAQRRRNVSVAPGGATRCGRGG